MVTRTLFALIVAAAAATPAAPAEEPAKPLPDLPADVFAPARREEPCVCTTWEARLADGERGQAELLRRYEEMGRRVSALAKEWAASPPEKLRPGEMKAELAAIGGRLAENFSFRVKLLAEAKAIVAEVRRHDDGFGPKVRHKPLRTWALIDPLEEDSHLTWIVAQDGTHLPEPPVVQANGVKPKVAAGGGVLPADRMAKSAR